MLQTTKVKVADLEIGMYVSALDRPWLETPFLIQGFVLETQEDIDRVRKYCEFVYVDRIRSQRSALRATLRAANGGTERAFRERPRVPVETIFAGRKIKPYPDDTALQDEQEQAELALESLLCDVVGLFDHVSAGGALDIVRVKGAVSPIVESMSRNPDACMWLTRMKQHDSYTYQHALSSSIWAVALGRQMGLGRTDLRSLAIGGLLMDIGKLRVDKALLVHPEKLDGDQEEQLRAHVDSGVELLREKGMMNQDVLDMVAHHHERYDGSGYPRGLSGDAIPPVARIAAIVDTYDALTTSRDYAPAISPSEAIRIIYNARDVEFQAELVEAFIQAVGVYPAGTLVELNSGETAVVVAESRTRRMLPKVIVLLDSEQQRLDKPRMVDLLKAAESQDSTPLRIRRSLEPGARGIDLAELGTFQT